MADLSFPEDFGWVNVTMGSTLQRLDLYAVHSRIVEETSKHRANLSALGKAWVDLVVELGFDPCSQYIASRFVNSILDTVIDLKKKEEAPDSTASASLAGSTASQSSTCPDPAS